MKRREFLQRLIGCLALSQIAPSVFSQIRQPKEKLPTPRNAYFCAIGPTSFAIMYEVY